jgi:hypothetical protein
MYIMYPCIRACIYYVCIEGQSKNSRKSSAHCILWHRRVGAIWVRTASAIPRREEHSSPSPSHRTLWISLRVAWLFPTLKMGLKGTRYATMEDIKSNATAKLRKIRKETFCRCRIDGASACARAQWSYALPLQCNITIPGTFWLAIIRTFACIHVYIYVNLCSYCSV